MKNKLEDDDTKIGVPPDVTFLRNRIAQHHELLTECLYHLHARQGELEIELDRTNDDALHLDLEELGETIALVERLVRE